MDEQERAMIAQATADIRRRLAAHLSQIDREGMLGTSVWAVETECALIAAGLVIGSGPRDGIPYNCAALTAKGRAVLDAGGDMAAGADIEPWTVDARAG